jgi:hypothetical protein
MPLSDRQETVLRALMDSVGGLTNAQICESILHHSVNLRLRHAGEAGAVLSEFEVARDFAEAQRWVRGVRTPTGRVRWCITDLGRAALAELNAA